MSLVSVWQMETSVYVIVPNLDREVRLGKNELAVILPYQLLKSSCVLNFVVLAPIIFNETTIKSSIRLVLRLFVLN